MKTLSKVLFTFGLLFIFIGLVVLRKDEITTLFNNYLSPTFSSVKLENKNSYYRDYDFLFVQNTNNFSPKSFQDILNIYYTVINSGTNSFTFYCNKEYETCSDDVEKLANNKELLASINDYVHPFNSYSHIETQMDNLGKVSITVFKKYSDEYIDLINDQVDSIYNELYDSKNSLKDNIKVFHDYIINNTVYDSLRSDQKIYKYKSDNAYGPLFEGYAVCGGYTDLMQLFLEKLKVKNYRVSSDIHIWNAVYVDNNWYHLDLTWDDPVAEDGINRLRYDYFLIDTDRLLKEEKTEHNYNEDNFLELKK